jgi:glycosyltransferase involved in cell wall biosynthesis
MTDDVPDGDVVVATWWETAEWAAALPEPKGAKALFIQGYERFPWIPVERLDATWRLPFHKIVPSQWLADIARDKFGDDDVSIVSNGIDTTVFTAEPRAKQSAFAVGFVYSDMPWKGIDIALNAIDLAREEWPNLKAVSVGHGHPTSELPLPEDIVFHSNANDGELREIYASCDVWLFTSREEGFGLPIIEAMACRTPVIATSAGAAPELLADGGGLLVDSHEPKAVADAIGRVAGMDNSAWRGFSDTAYTTAQSYTYEASTDAFEKALQRAVEKREAIRPC